MRPSRFIQWVGTAALLGASLLASIGLAEIVLRIRYDEVWRERPQGSLKEFDDTLGWRLRPNASSFRLGAEYEIHQETNVHGMRGHEIPLRKPEGEFRILVLGDSFAEGYTVDFEELFSEELERVLRRSSLGPSVEVMNSGVNGYSTDQELLVFRDLGRRLEPDLTILLFVYNDVWYNAEDRYQSRPKPRFEWDGEALRLGNVPLQSGSSRPHQPRSKPSALERVGGWIDRLAGRSYLQRVSRESTAQASYLVRRWSRRLGLRGEVQAEDYAGDGLPGVVSVWEKPRSPAVEEAWLATERLLLELRREVEASGSSFLIFYVPVRASVYPDEWERTATLYGLTEDRWDPGQVGEDLAGFAAEVGLDLIEPTAVFVRRASELDADGRRLYFVNDAHWTREGHALTGRLLADAVLERQAARGAADPSTGR